MSVPGEVSAGEALGVLSRFRAEFYDSLYARADTLFELTDSVLYADGPGRSERWSSCRWPSSTGVATALCTRPWTGAGPSRHGCVER